MTQGSPWSVKGVAASEREAAKVAARRAGVPIGAWLSETIRRASADGAEERAVASHRALPSPAWPLYPAVQANQPAAVLQQRATSRALEDAMVDAIRRLGHRLDETERRTAARLASVIEQIETLGRDIASLGDRLARLEGLPARLERLEEPRSTAALERSITRLAARIERLEGRAAAEPPPAGAAGGRFGRR